MKRGINLAAWASATGWVAVAASLGWSCWNSKPRSDSGPWVLSSQKREALPEASVPPVPDVVVWTEPRPGKGAPRELFTPPWVGADPAPASVIGSKTTSGPPSALSTKWPELVEVREDLFPVQLIGFAGTGKHAGGIFELTATGETVIAREGHVFASLGLALVALEVKRPRSSAARSKGSVDWQAGALVQDTLSGASVRLESQRRHRSEPVALLRLPDTPELRPCRAGDVVAIGDLTFNVVRVQATPPAVELTQGVESTQSHRIEPTSNFPQR